MPDNKKLDIFRKNFKLAVCLALAAALLFSFSGCAVILPAEYDTDVGNSSDFSTDVIYQIVTDRFFDGDSTNNATGNIFDKNNMRKYHGGDWAGIKQKIEQNYFTDLGVTALWISSPVENISSIDPSNGSASYHGYWAKDFFRPNPYFGTMKDFNELITAAHSKNIKVVVDFAPNHTSTAELGNVVFPEDGELYRDGVLLGGFKNDTANLFNHESWTDSSTWENAIYHSLYGLADLNQQNPVVDGYLKDAVKLWLETGIDGLRVDAVKHMPMGWQKNWVSEIYSSAPVFVFGEWFHNNSGNDVDMQTFANGSGMSLLDFRFANASRAVFGTKKMNMYALSNMLSSTREDFVEVKDQVTFIDNHDMPRFLTVSGGNSLAVDMAYALMLTSRGIPTVYYGTEQYLVGGNDPDNRADMPSFSADTNAYKVISKLAPLRKTNAALSYGNTEVRYVSSDAIVYERRFGGSSVLCAVNRSASKSVYLSGIDTALPNGSYQDALGGILQGKELHVLGGAADYELAPNEFAVWQYSAEENELLIGNVGPTYGIAGNTATICGRGFGEKVGSVTFGSQKAEIVSWSDSLIRIKVPAVVGGDYNIGVKSAKNKKDTYGNFTVLSGPQTCVRFNVENVPTTYGQNVYLSGNIFELGAWDETKLVGPFFHDTETIASYPDWFYDISLPKNTDIEYKFVVLDSSGRVVKVSQVFRYRTGNENASVSVKPIF